MRARVPEIRRPGVELGPWQRRPLAPFPGTEIELDQPGILCERQATRGGDPLGEPTAPAKSGELRRASGYSRRIFSSSAVVDVG